MPNAGLRSMSAQPSVSQKLMKKVILLRSIMFNAGLRSISVQLSMLQKLARKNLLRRRGVGFQNRSMAGLA